MKIVTQTQIRENYGAHDWNGEGECPQHWKYKGGNTYVTENVTIAQAQDRDFWKSIGAAITTYNESWEEYSVGYELLDEGEPVPCEEWDSPIILSETAIEGLFNATRTSKTFGWRNDNITQKEETWIQSGGEQSEYLLRFLTKSGEVMNWRGEPVAA
jgi:hypothetical protein